MVLLIDLIEDTAAYVHERREKLERLQRSYRTSADPDIKKEVRIIRHEIGKKNTQLRAQVLLSLDEFRALNKYYPELLAVLMEDDCVGKTLSKKSWLLEFHEFPADFAASKLAEIRNWRHQLKEVKKSLARYGNPSAKSLLSTYPFLTGIIKPGMDKGDILGAIEKSDASLNKEGWLVLISSALIEIPLAKFVRRLMDLQAKESLEANQALRLRGKGSVAEVASLRKLQATRRKKEHYENLIIQILLSNPNYLRALKKKTPAHSSRDSLMKIAKTLTPHTVHERVWLNEMKKRVGES